MELGVQLRPQHILLHLAKSEHISDARILNNKIILKV